MFRRPTSNPNYFLCIFSVSLSSASFPPIFSKNCCYVLTLKTLRVLFYFLFFFVANAPAFSSFSTGQKISLFSIKSYQNLSQFFVWKKRPVNKLSFNNTLYGSWFFEIRLFDLLCFLHIFGKSLAIVFFFETSYNTSKLYIFLIYFYISSSPLIVFYFLIFCLENFVFCIQIILIDCISVYFYTFLASYYKKKCLFITNSKAVKSFILLILIQFIFRLASLKNKLQHKESWTIMMSLILRLLILTQIKVSLFGFDCLLFYVFLPQKLCFTYVF